MPGAAFVERLDRKRRLAFDNTEPLASRQWYLPQIRAWDFWPDPPKLFTTRVAVIDSGIDGDHPEFFGRVTAAKSFVGGSPYEDFDGHGTFVAGEIAANPTNADGIAGIAVDARLVIAKVVQADGSVSLRGEVDAIRWAVDVGGARVINLSLGGVRDPFDPKIDTYSPLEQAAVDYAYSKGAVIVAAVGNGPQSPTTPWNHAHYPAALPHVIGVSAIRQNGSVPDYSNRDPIYNDVTAPGDAIFSTIPRDLMEDRAGCHPYSDCGPFEFRNAIGTSFAAPQAAAAAALLLGQNPALRPDQVAWLLERTASDVNAETGCSKCNPRRDPLAGWGRVDVTAALERLTDGTLPRADAFEPNDDAGAWSRPFGPPRTIAATVDYWDDQIDVYSVTLRKAQRLFVRLSPPARTAVKVMLWKPGTKRVEGLRAPVSFRAAQSARVGAQERLAYTAQAPGKYFLEVKVQAPTPAGAPYRLSVAMRR